MIRSVFIWSMHDLPLLNPACSFRNLTSTWWIIRSRIIFMNTFITVQRIVIPRQLLQSVASPFFGSLTIMPFVQSDGKVSEFQICTKRGCNISVNNLVSVLRTSAVMLSTPAALPFFRLFIAFVTSRFEGGFVLMCRVSMLLFLVTATLSVRIFKTLMKCSL